MQLQPARIADKQDPGEPDEIVHVEAYVLDVEMSMRNEVVYKLTPDTIDALTALTGFMRVHTALMPKKAHLTGVERSCIANSRTTSSFSPPMYPH